MAQVSTVSLVDDLDGGEAHHEAVRFGVDGRWYEIDLSAQNRDRLMRALAEFVGAARPLGGRGRRDDLRISGGRTKANREQNQAIREWATRQGISVSERGRIPAEVLDAYHGRSVAALATRAATVPEPGAPQSWDEISSDLVLAWYQAKGLRLPKNYKNDGRPTGLMRAKYARAHNIPTPAAGTPEG